MSEETTSIKMVNVPEDEWKRCQAYMILFQDFFKEVAKQGGQQALYRLSRKNQELMKKNDEYEEQDGEHGFL